VEGVWSGKRSVPGTGKGKKKEKEKEMKREEELCMPCVAGG
jgi:hypothetical protein